MPDPIDALDYMFAAWNETDASRIRALLEKALDPDVRFVDPSIEIEGIDQFEANVHDVHAKHPGNSYARSSKVDSHHNVHRYHWEICDSAGECLLPGFDVVETNEQGRVMLVVGFFGTLSNDSP